MVFARLLITSFLAIGANALPSLLPRSGPSSWTIQVFPDAAPQKFNGTITEVFTTILKENPNFEKDFPTYKKQLIAMGWLTTEQAAACEEEAGVTVITRRDAPTSWTLPVFPDTTPQKFNGTITEVFTTVLKENPNFEKDFPTYKKQLIAMGWLTADQAAACEEAAGVTVVTRDVETSRDTNPPTTWNIQVFPDGPVEVFHGTMPEVFYQVLVENPDFEKDFPTWKAQVIALGWMTAEEAAEAEAKAGVSDSRK